ncbi:hypothetical protein GIS00_05480 [Nakamurella sp. YIM 132087]|uniref:SH3 domain-containing protein n=1 Tax=Nakamurella alba TaxID=2665158 RepID=A0A7K1FGY8_9ACTN|nr:hypothetical protein [Nakamurella alba]MTD13397.1 hypothetical protein [Nakamurella alba]
MAVVTHIRRGFAALGIVTALALGSSIPASAAPVPDASTSAARASAVSLTMTRTSANIGTEVIGKGTLTAAGSDVRLADRPVEVWVRTPGYLNWVHTQNTRTNALGHYAFAQSFKQATIIEVRFPGGYGWAPASSPTTQMAISVGFFAVAFKGCSGTNIINGELVAAGRITPPQYSLSAELQIRTAPGNPWIPANSMTVGPDGIFSLSNPRRPGVYDTRWVVGGQYVVPTASPVFSGTLPEPGSSSCNQFTRLG